MRYEKSMSLKYEPASEDFHIFFEVVLVKSGTVGWLPCSLVGPTELLAAFFFVKTPGKESQF